MECNRALCLDQCFLPYTLHHSALRFPFSKLRNLLRSCKIVRVMAVSAWIKGSKLKLNASKTEFLIGTKLKRDKFLNNTPCLILGQDTNPSARKAR